MIKAYFFPGPVREPETIVIAKNELEAKAEFKRISGRVMDPRRVREVVVATPDVVEMMQVELQGNTPKRKFDAVDEFEFPILSYFGGELPDVNNDDPARWDALVDYVNEALPWVRIEDGGDLRERLINEMNRWERKYT